MADSVGGPRKRERNDQDFMVNREGAPSRHDKRKTVEIFMALVPFFLPAEVLGQNYFNSQDVRFPSKNA